AGPTTSSQPQSLETPRPECGKLHSLINDHHLRLIRFLYVAALRSELKSSAEKTNWEKPAASSDCRPYQALHPFSPTTHENRPLGWAFVRSFGSSSPGAAGCSRPLLHRPAEILDCALLTYMYRATIAVHQ